jgi:beta-glucosidase-like glycosyl hydrolase
MAPASSSEQEPLVFAIQEGGTYDGLPLFDAEPSHLDAYLDVLMDYVGLEGAARWANGYRNDYRLTQGPNAGKTIPGAPQFDEGVQGIITDFPAQMGMSQSWNKELLADIGGVMAAENLYTENYATRTLSSFHAMISAAQQDIRANPLSGRLDEDFGEDPELASQLIDHMTRSMSGTDDPANEDGFWTKAIIDTKHFTNYNAQWYRTQGNFDASQRSLMEYTSYPAMRGFSSGAVNAFMTSYGRTNGIPNNVSPLVQYVQSLTPYGAHQTNDHSSENQLATANSFSNGFDTRYTPSNADTAALFTLANTGGVAATNPNSYPIAAFLAEVEAGTYGITPDDVFEVAKAQVTQLIRMGLFNERDDDGQPIGYPFLSLSAISATPYNGSTAAHQEAALAASQEAIVLLKNDGTLPLAKDSEVAVVGPLSNALFSTTRTQAVPAGLVNAGLTPLGGITAVGGDPVMSGTDGEIVRLKSVATGQYLSFDTVATSPSVYANAEDSASAATFEVFDWGQEAVSLRSPATGRWFQGTASAVNVGGNAPFGTSRTTLPNRLRIQQNDDDTVSIVANAFGGGFGGGFETSLYSAGRYVTVNPDTTQLGVTAVLGDQSTMQTLNTESTKFEVEVVTTAGSGAAQLAQGADGAEYAIVVIGDSPRNSAGEGQDRSTLYLGPDQYELVDNVAAAYPGKTIVVVSATNPVIVESVQANPDVAAVVALPYNGEFGGLALGQVVFGDISPSGHLTQTWYADMSALPTINEYSIPEGRDTAVTLDNIDPRITVDMSNGDPAELNLTYQYTDAPVTYPFGHGLTYPQVNYGGLTVAPAGADQYVATVPLTNVGLQGAFEVVQLYASNPDWSYGDAAPKLKLVAFEKIWVPAGESQTARLTFDASNLALWNTNADDWRTQPGTYTFSAGRSSADLEDTTTVVVAGDSWPSLDASQAPVNVFDKAFAAQDVTYRESSKANTVAGFRNDKLVNGYYTVMSRKAGAWAALSDVAFDGTEERVTLTVASTNDSSSVELRLDAPDGPLLGSAAFQSTGSAPYLLAGLTEAADISGNEIAYVDVDVAIADPVAAGAHDVYIVFGQAGVRVRDLYLAPPALDLGVGVTTRCLAGRVVLTVQTTNDDALPATVSVGSAYGTAASASVAPAKKVSSAFTIRQTSVPAGQVRVTGVGVVEGGGRAPVADLVVTYPAFACG